MASSEKEDKNPVSRIPFLIQIYGENVNKRYRLKGPSVIIGRHPKSNIKLDSVNVSRRHCILNCTEGKWSIKDNNSQNGTYVNGRKVEKNQIVYVNIGDIIFLGPPAENPQAFIFDDYLDETDHALVSQDPEKEKVLDVNAQSSEEFNDSHTVSTSSKSSEIINKQEANVSVLENVPEIMDTSDGIFSEDQKKKIPQVVNSALKDQELNTPSTSNTLALSKDPKLDIGRKLAVKNNTGAEDVQVEEISQSLLDAASDDILSQNPYPFSLRLDESAKENPPSVKKEIIPFREVKMPSQEADNEILKSKLALLSEEIKQLKNSKSELLKEYEDMYKKNKVLDEKLVEQQKLKEDVQMCELRIKNKLKNQIMEKLEEDLICNICTEVLIKPTVLDCSHTFCEHCIMVWKKKKAQCPVCRNHIKSQTRVLALDHFIDKTLESLTPDQKQKRIKLMIERENAKSKPKPKPTSAKGRRRRRSSNRRGRLQAVSNSRIQNSHIQNSHIQGAHFQNESVPRLPRNISINLQRLYQVPVDEISVVVTRNSVPLPRPSVPPIAPTAYVPEIILTSDSEFSEEEMFADPCYNCGRYGHVPYECPG